MTPVQITEDRLSDERLREILAATRGATPGPWEVKTQAEWTTGFDFFSGTEGAFCFPVDLEAADALHIANCDPQTIASLVTELLAAREALTPSGDTKAAYMAEFHFTRSAYDQDGEEYTENVMVPWTTIKEIMAAIKARALKETTNAA